ncbi:MAG: CRTAC1 family protein, partial [Chloroflexi bacterium]|nr:CRTAC1 family protein [Chloroflexota bacterium]
TWDPCEPIAYYRNEGDGTFTDFSEKAGLSGQLGGLNITQTDYDNDGWMDVLVMRGGWMKTRGQMRMSLLRNGGDGTFSDVTESAGLAKPAYPSQSAAWADYDNDGDLDMFSCNESMREEGVESTALMFPSQLFRNDGSGHFEDVAQDAGVQNWRYCKGSAWGDYNNDGDADLYISNFGEDNRLYRNNGDGTFSDVAAELGITAPFDSFATWFWDYNNDGWLDIFVAGYGEDIEEVAADYMDLKNEGTMPRLYRNLGGAGFEDVTRENGLWRVHLSMGANFGDLDNDGYMDIFLGTGAPSYDALAPNMAYRNDAGNRFQDVTFSGGFGHLQKGHGVSFGDLDNDGDQDLFVQIGGFYPGDGFVNALYKNLGHGNHWLSIKLVGVKSNRAAIGARIKTIVVDEDGTRRNIYTTVSNGSSFGASTLTQEIGLGQAREIASLEVHWPASGIRQDFKNVPLDSHISIREDADDYDILDLPPVPLGIGP